MTPIRFGCWLGAGFLSVTLALGCRHAHRETVTYIPCECCEVTQPIPPKVPEKVKQTVGMLPAFEKKDDRPNVAYRVVAPGMSAGCDMVGTDEMTAADADKVNIRPGYTPGALWMPARHEEVPVVQKPAPEQPVAVPASAQETPAPQQPAVAPEAQTPELKKPETSEQ